MFRMVYHDWYVVIRNGLEVTSDSDTSPIAKLGIIFILSNVLFENVCKKLHNIFRIMQT